MTKTLEVWLSRPRPWLVLAVAEMAFVFWTSHRSWDGSGAPSGLGNLVHFGLYAVLGALLALGFGGGKPGAAARPALWWAAVFSAAAFGLLDELHQDRVPRRTCSVFDVVVDLLGAAFAVVLLRSWRLRGRPGPGALGLAAVLAAAGAVTAIWADGWAPGVDALLARD